MLHEAITWATVHQDALLALVGGGAGLAVLAQGLLHKILTKWPLAGEIQQKIFSYSFVQLLTLAAAFAAYYASNANFGVTYPWLATIVAVVHRFAVSPYYTKKILPYLEYEAAQNSSKARSQAQPLAPASQVETAPAPAAAFLS